MPGIHDFRAELASRNMEKSGMAGTVVGVLAAFVLGGLLVFGWQLVPARLKGGMSGAGAPRTAEVKISPSGDRLGRPETAPALRSCLIRLTSHSDFPFPSEADPSAIYAILGAANMYAGAVRVLGKPQDTEAFGFAALWGSLAECVYNHDAPTLCDIDNRALAVDVVSNFVRHADRAATEFANASGPVRIDLSQFRAIKDRLLISLQSHLKDGVLIAADFGWFTPEDVRRIARETTPTRDVCAGVGR